MTNQIKEKGRRINIVFQASGRLMSPLLKIMTIKKMCIISSRVRMRVSVRNPFRFNCTVFKEPRYTQAKGFMGPQKFRLSTRRKLEAEEDDLRPTQIVIATEAVDMNESAQKQKDVTGCVSREWFIQPTYLIK